MTRLYRPVLIESAEQAEALPVGTVATDLGARIVSAAVRTDVGLGWFVSGDEMTDMHEHLVGWTALVPIEAEEEWGGSRPNSGAWECQNRSHAEDDAAGWNRSAGPDGFHSVPVRRLVTPWEEA